MYEKNPVLFSRKEQCCGCGACLSICPQKAISMLEDEEGFDYPIVDKSLCIKCLLCMKICPIKKTRER